MATSLKATPAAGRPPFRAEIVGSFLRPAKLKAARERFLGPQTADSNNGPHDNAELRAVEDDCIREIVAMQERAGLKVVTDGEFRRRNWSMDLLLNWEGLQASRTGNTELTWKGREGRANEQSSVFTFSAPLRWRPSKLVQAFKFLQSATRVTPKVTMPGPCLVHNLAGGDNRIRQSIYRDTDSFWADVVAAYRAEIQALIDAGCRYIQLDDTSFAMLCDPDLRRTIDGWGQPVDALLREYTRRTNEVVAGFPAEVTFALHQCRGNREGMWMASGGYDPIADVLFNQTNVAAFFLEYDTDRAGTFAPLRYLPRGKTAVLGLMSTKTASLESADELRRRIDEAAAIAPLDQLAISPQCGFASSIGGNPLSEAEQEAKLARLVAVATEVWGSA
ncbi:MAG: 5-methyltetrahydropteroyltriglutamate--homocysteine S-methyltransferase [Rhodospirillaceae bacterium]